MKRFDVQILIENEWRWAGVAPSPMTMRDARACKARMALHPYWREQVGVRRLRIWEVPSSC